MRSCFICDFAFCFCRRMCSANSLMAPFPPTLWQVYFAAFMATTGASPGTALKPARFRISTSGLSLPERGNTMKPMKPNKYHKLSSNFNTQPVFWFNSRLIFCKAEIICQLINQQKKWLCRFLSCEDFALLSLSHVRELKKNISVFWTVRWTRITVSLFSNIS